MAAFSGKSYPDWLKSLTKEEYDAHIKKRRDKADRKKKLEAAQNYYGSEWASFVYNADLMLLKKAYEEGDIQGYVALRDRVFGKPKESIEVSGNTVLPLSMDNFGEDNNDE